jgi:hypothetical protein
MAIILLVGGGASLVELRKTHAYTHRMLQILFSTPTHTCLFLFVKCLAPKRLHTVTETSLNQWVIHLQAATPFREPESIRPCSQRPCFHIQHKIKPNSQSLPYWNWERKPQNTAYYMWSAKDHHPRWVSTKLPPSNIYLGSRGDQGMKTSLKTE